MPSGLPNLILENFTLTISPEQIKAIVKHTVEVQNQGYYVESVTFDITKGVIGDYGQSDIPPGLRNVEVKMKKKEGVFPDEQ